MIQVENLSYGFPDKELYHDISFRLEAGRHCALIGSNGSGKSTLVDMLMRPDQYWFDGRITRDENCRVGYAGQFSARDKARDCTVFDYLAERFTGIAAEIAETCDAMAEPHLDEAGMTRLFARYQTLLDQSEAMDAEHYESTIYRQLHTAGMRELAETKLSEVSGGEYKLLQIMREMLLAPNLLVLDEPDAFLDFANLNGLCGLINTYRGTLLAVTHNRYLLHHCFDKVLHLENRALQEFDGSYGAYRCAMLREKLTQRLRHIEEQEEIARTEEMVELLRKRATLMVNPTIGQAVNAKQSQLDRLRVRQIQAPFIEAREPRITLPEVNKNEAASGGLPAREPASKRHGEAPREETSTQEPRVLLQVRDYEIKFDEHLLRDVNFTIREGEKVALIGPNGTGKTTLFRMIMGLEQPTEGTFRVGPTVKLAYVDQQHKSIDPEKTVYEVISQGADLITLGNRQVNARAYVARFNFSGADQEKKCGMLSGGERNRLHLALALKEEGNVLLLDEPTNDIDVNTLRALEEGLENFAGCAVVISHDRWFLDRIATHILSFEGDSKVVFYEGSYSEYEAWKRAQGGDVQPHRVKYKKLIEA